MRERRKEGKIGRERGKEREALITRNRKFLYRGRMASRRAQKNKTIEKKNYEKRGHGGNNRGNYPTIAASWAAEERKRERTFLRNSCSGVVQLLRFAPELRGSSVPRK